MNKSLEIFARAKLQELFDKLTESQQSFFKRLYPYGDISGIPVEKLDWAITQCENTIKNNKDKP